MGIDDVRDAARFAVEIDGLKRVERESSVIGGWRRENTAEHSWHVAMLAWLLIDSFPVNADLGRVIRMLLVHDLLELDIGDEFAYAEDSDQQAAFEADLDIREQRAARRVLSRAPNPRADEFLSLWLEFRADQTLEARVAQAIDKSHPVVLNAANLGDVWRRHRMSADRVRRRIAFIEDLSPEYHEYLTELIDESVLRGSLAPDAAPVD